VSVRFADVVSGDLGIAWLGREAGSVRLHVEGDIDAEFASVCQPAWARPGNGGVLQMAATSLWVRNGRSEIWRLSSHGARLIAEVPGVLQLAASPAGFFVAARTAAHVVVFDEAGALVSSVRLERLGIHDAWDLAIGEDATLAIARSGPREPWITGAVELIAADGALVGRIGSDQGAIVEPRFDGTRLWVRDDRGGVACPRPAEGSVPEVPGMHCDLGEYPLGPGRRGYVVGAEGVVAIAPCIEEAGVVRLASGSAERVRTGLATSLSLHRGDLVRLELGPLRQAVVAGERVLAWCEEPATGFEVRRLSELAGSLPGIALVPPAPRGLALVVHGGPVEQVGWPLPEKWVLLARAGLLVVAPDYPGSYGYGRQARLSLIGGYGDVEVASLAELLDALRDVPGPRLGVGASSAGWTLLQLHLVRGDLLDALWLVNPVLVPEEVPGTEWLVSSRALERTRRVHARRIPVVITQGLDDGVVPRAQTQRFQATWGEALECVVTWASGEGHSLSEEAAAAELARLRAFVAGLLAGWVGRR